MNKMKRTVFSDLSCLTSSKNSLILFFLNVFLIKIIIISIKQYADYVLSDIELM